MTRIGWLSPFNPQKSGISDFSEELLPDLAKQVDVDVFFDGRLANGRIASEFTQRPVSDVDDPAVRGAYDLLVFQVGNNVVYHKRIVEAFLRHSGVLELHDFSMHNYLAADTYLHNDIPAYLATIRHSHGEPGVRIVRRFLDGHAQAPWETHAMELAANRHLLDRARAVIVHSDMALQMTRALRPDVPAIHIPLHASDLPPDPQTFRSACRARLGIPDGRLVFGSFGYVTRTKRILQLLEALGRFRAETGADFLFLLTGKVEDVDVDAAVTRAGLDGLVVRTGFASLDEFKTNMGACDVCFNLRFPSHGESSGSLHRMLGMGKCIVATDIGPFNEYPADVVRLVRHGEDEVDDLLAFLREVRSGRFDVLRAGRKAQRYAETRLGLDRIVGLYVAFFEDLVSDRFQPGYADLAVDRLMDLGLLDEAYVRHFAGNLGTLLGEEDE
jgi:glycosyltransferase involved in cell wall biosynthesis